MIQVNIPKNNYILLLWYYHYIRRNCGFVIISFRLQNTSENKTPFH